ncbi:hypothetical protein C4561_01405 [candidate division WWE3 bacterium]|uniref:Uncharacterized protein n=1 Tax=candidate division WWE3 bacterium TaxID=2053526 RepID=A0A3A4ZF09_UNCKA|nr:MAG: hypothetical protein C4561_01405 [candidate division WWE3 bacterium]
MPTDIDAIVEEAMEKILSKELEYWITSSDTHFLIEVGTARIEDALRAACEKAAEAGFHIGRNEQLFTNHHTAGEGEPK